MIAASSDPSSRDRCLAPASRASSAEAPVIFVMLHRVTSQGLSDGLAAPLTVGFVGGASREVAVSTVRRTGSTWRAHRME